ncbi:hypothetical protein [Methyloprofundus sedimenti]|nr:hypothetical protein [Methyloprofundus sedimenti]
MKKSSQDMIDITLGLAHYSACLDLGQGRRIRGYSALMETFFGYISIKGC